MQRAGHTNFTTTLGYIRQVESAGFERARAGGTRSLAQNSPCFGPELVGETGY